MPDIAFALAVCEKMEIFDNTKKKAIFRFVKLYPQEKVIRIVDQAKTYWWWKKNGVAAFMKAVGDINKEERLSDDAKRVDKDT